MSHLFTPIRLRELEVANRAWVAPMCMYSAVDGVVGDFHIAHLGSFSFGRAGLVMAEATGVVPEGRISGACPGIWNDTQVAAWKRVVDLLHSQGTPVGLQLAHAGRKGSTFSLWVGGVASLSEGGWETVSASAEPYDDMPTPRALTVSEIHETVSHWAAAARRARAAGFDVVEVHSAHGYLLHQFLSPLSNLRSDEYGGSLDNRMRFPLAVAAAVRDAWPEELPVIVRISATDWTPGGFNVEEATVYVAELKRIGIDVVDVSSGGLHPAQRIPRDVNYQVDIAAQIKAATGMTISAVGLITTAEQAERIISSGQADVVSLARAFLRDPHWPLRAAHELGVTIPWIPQYEWGLPWG